MPRVGKWGSLKNRGAGYRLEIPVRYSFQGPSKWVD